jgi:hypothetical protein
MEQAVDQAGYTRPGAPLILMGESPGWIAAAARHISYKTSPQDDWLFDNLGM